MCALPPVPDRAALAPAKVNSPSAFRCSAARWLEIVEVHTLCFHIRSVFLYKSRKEKLRISFVVSLLSKYVSDYKVLAFKHSPQPEITHVIRQDLGNNIHRMLISCKVDIKSCPFYSENCLFLSLPVADFHAGCR